MPFVVQYSTVTVSTLGFDNVTTKFALVVPVFPSSTEVSAMSMVGACSTSMMVMISRLFPATAFVTPVNSTLNVSLPSYKPSANIAIPIVTFVSPGANTIVPDVGAKSLPAVAVPFTARYPTVTVLPLTGVR